LNSQNLVINRNRRYFRGVNAAGVWLQNFCPYNTEIKN
jgi:hypothetical protein